jgi:hypothetical protein
LPPDIDFVHVVFKKRLLDFKKASVISNVDPVPDDGKWKRAGADGTTRAVRAD